MIDTETTIEKMPRLLASFKRYIEKYVCTYEVNVKDGHQVYSLEFYDNSKMPYIIICVDDESTYPIIYVNKNGDNWGKENCLIRPENYISNNMKAFIEEIRKCAETNPQKTVWIEV